jgi:hypothetical protein
MLVGAVLEHTTCCEMLDVSPQVEQRSAPLGAKHTFQVTPSVRRAPVRADASEWALLDAESRLVKYLTSLPLTA